MPRILFFALCVTWSLSAHAAGLEATYRTWERLRDPEVSAIRFDDGIAFLTHHPGWPEEKLIRLRTETAAFTEAPSHPAMEQFCSAFAPLSGRGMLACAVAGIGAIDQQNRWVRQGWLQGDFNADEEERIRTRFRKLLTRDDHLARTERLLYDGSAKAAQRMLPLIPREHRHIAETRIALMTNDRHSLRLLKHLSAAELRDPGILFERARWRQRRGEDAALAELLTAAPNDVAYPDRWWPLRAAAARDAIHKRHYQTALKVVEHHGDLEDSEDLAEALWLKGWLNLTLGDAATGYKAFHKLYTSVYTPVSKARAAYWAGRAAEKNGNHDIAKEWMRKAARYPTVFYGQLASHWLEPKKPLKLPATPIIGAADRQRLSEDPLVIIARQREAAGDHTLHDRFLAARAARTTGEQEFAALAAVGREVGTIATGVEIAKLALRNNIVLLDFGWPRMDLPKNLPIEPALTLAITRQESEFDPNARSPANARGLMQLLPSTARQMARTMGLPYRDSMLTNPADNVTLGANYLARMIDGFEGSYILGIASYNAGPGNVRKWIAARGVPPRDPHAAIDWIESIPFGETRNYVMRVLENVSVYRTLANPEAPLMIENDLVR